jgi:hypothetical protein
MVNWKGFGRKQSWYNFKVLFQHSPGGTDETHEKPQDIRSPGSDFNPGPPEYEAGMLTTRPRPRRLRFYVESFRWIILTKYFNYVLYSTNMVNKMYFIIC